MTTGISVQALFVSLCDKLALTWVAGKTGAERRILPHEPANAVQPWVGHMNFIQSNQIQVLGSYEMAYLGEARDPSAQLAQLFGDSVAAVMIADREPIPSALADAADRTDTPLFSSPRSGEELIGDLQYYLASLFASRTTLHGVFMEVYGVGVLLTGEASVGKSELALELLSRGHRLIADDAPEFSRLSPDALTGNCPEVLRDYLEVRGLGVLNVRALFGDSAIKHSDPLRLIIHLKHMALDELNRIDRLSGSAAVRRLLEVEIPEVTLPVAPGRNLAVLVEAAVRNYILRDKGYDASEHFMRQQERHMS